MKRDDVWANEGGTPGMPICKIALDSEAASELLSALKSDRRYLRISAHGGNFKVKVGEGIWTPPLDVEGGAR